MDSKILQKMHMLTASSRKVTKMSIRDINSL